MIEVFKIVNDIYDGKVVHLHYITIILQ